MSKDTTFNPESIRRGRPAFDIAQLRDPELLSELVHKLGHEINNPLTSIISFATILERFSSDSSKQSTKSASSPGAGYATSILSEAWRINRLTQRLVLLLSLRSGNVGKANLGKAIERAISAIERIPSGTTFEIEAEDAIRAQLTVQADAEQLFTLVTELIENSIEALTALGATNSPIQIVSRELAAGEGSKVELIIRNAAAPNATADLGELFAPFITTRPEQRHIGLGLTVVGVIVQRFKGSIEVSEETTSQGTFFQVRATFPGVANNTKQSAA